MIAGLVLAPVVGFLHNSRKVKANHGVPHDSLVKEFAHVALRKFVARDLLCIDRIQAHGMHTDQHRVLGVLREDRFGYRLGQYLNVLVAAVANRDSKENGVKKQKKRLTAELGGLISYDIHRKEPTLPIQW